MTKKHNRLYTIGTKARQILALQRTQQAIELRLEGKTLTEIADKMGLSSRGAVRWAILRGMKKIVQPEKCEELRQREIAKLDEVEQEAWEQWDRSKENAESVTKKKGKDGTETITKSEGQSGNPAHLDKIIRCCELRSKLLGLYEPEKKVDIPYAEYRVIGQTPAEVFEAAAKRARDALQAKGKNATGQ